MEIVQPQQLNALALIAQAAPTVDAQFAIAALSRVFHLVAAVIIGGGLFYLRTILAPSGADACFANRRQLWAKWVGIATFLVLASGIYNLIQVLNKTKAAGIELPSTYHMLFGVKFLIALFVLFVAAIVPGKTDLAEKFRQQLAKWLNLGWAGVLAVIVLGALLSTMRGSLLLEAAAGK